jgi:hypothetical protein
LLLLSFYIYRTPLFSQHFLCYTIVSERAGARGILLDF